MGLREGFVGAIGAAILGMVPELTGRPPAGGVWPICEALAGRFCACDGSIAGAGGRWRGMGIGEPAGRDGMGAGDAPAPGMAVPIPVCRALRGWFQITCGVPPAWE